MGLSNYLPSSRLIQPGVCTSSTRPASPFEGQYIYETDTNRTLVYDGGAWVMTVDADTPPALELVKVQTIGSAVPSVTVSDVFTATYTNYKIVLTGGYGSNNGTSLRMTVSGATGSTYRYGGYYTDYAAGTITGAGASGAAFWLLGEVSDTAHTVECDVFQPQIASAFTQFSTWTIGHQYARTMHGHDTSATSSTGFTISCGAGTLTGGTIRVYGYRNSI